MLRIEHHAVLHSCAYMKRFGFETTYVPVDKHGLVDPDAIGRAVNERTVLVSVMLANNEVGTIEPVADIARAVRQSAEAMKRRVPVHTDAVQRANALELSVEQLGVDLLSLSAHKFCGPKGVGALYLRRVHRTCRRRAAAARSGSAGRELRTSPGLLGQPWRYARRRRTGSRTGGPCGALSKRLMEGIAASVQGAVVNGHPDGRLPNNVHFSFEGAESDTMLAALDKQGIAASAGSACTSATWEPSHVLTAICIPLQVAAGVLRLTVGPENTDEEIDHVLAVLPRVVMESRAQAVRRLTAK